MTILDAYVIIYTGLGISRVSSSHVLYAQNRPRIYGRINRSLGKQQCTKRCVINLTLPGSVSNMVRYCTCVQHFPLPSARENISAHSCNISPYWTLIHSTLILRQWSSSDKHFIPSLLPSSLIQIAISTTLHVPIRAGVCCGSNEASLPVSLM